VSDDTPVTPDAPDGTDSDHLDLHSEPEFAETRPVEQVPAWEADHPGQEPDEAIVTTRPHPSDEPSPDVTWVRHRPLLGPIPRWGGVAAVVLLGAAVAFSGFRGWVDNQLRPSAPPGDDVELTIQEGWSTNDVAVALGDSGVIDHPAMFRQWMRCPSGLQWLINCQTGTEYSFQAGNYVLQEHLSFEDTVALLEEGPLPEEVVRITIPEGLTLNQMVNRVVRRMPTFDEAQMRAALSSDRLIWEHYPGELPFLLVEGLLFPDTYQLDDATITDELGLLIRMHNQFLAVVRELDLEQRSVELGLTPYDAVILASLIEEEALLDGDRAKISRVIHNRLNLGWTLGIDASTRYAVAKTAGEPLTDEDLATESLWNTRVVAGLPPTPIAGPGRASLEAALAPVDGPWLYYVRTDENDVVGAHTFAETADEFEAARRVCVEKDLGCG